MNPDDQSRADLVSKKVRGLYGIVDIASDELDWVGRAELLGRALLAAGVTVLQLRMKHAGARQMIEAGRPLRALCAEHQALFVINDRLDVALAVGADAVHLGQDDLPLEAARRIAPPQMIIGVSTHNPAQADAASSAGADYLGFGPIFQTRSKEKPDPTVGVETLALVCHRIRVPVVAIGGIGLQSISEVGTAGAAAAAIISAVNSAPDVTAAARAAIAAFDRGNTG